MDIIRVTKKNIKQIIPKETLNFFIKLRNNNKKPEKIFTEIYKKKIWGKDPKGGEYFSGNGSIDNVIGYKKFLINFIEDRKIKNVFEIGAGDFRIMKSVLSQVDVNYIGCDVVKELISYLSLSYSDEKINFLHIDAINDKTFPNAELCIIRQVLQHLNNSQIIEVLKKTKLYKYVLISEHVPLNPTCKNGDRYIGEGIRLQNKEISGVYLDAPPFSLKTKVLFSYRNDEKDIFGNHVPALIQTSLIENLEETSANNL